MAKHRKRIFCLLAAFMLLITNSSIMSVFAEEDTAKSTDTVRLESSDEAASSTETTPTSSTAPAGKTNPVGKSRPAAEMDTTSKSGSVSDNTASVTKKDVDISPGSAEIDLKAGAGERTIYFDAARSKVNYSGNDSNMAGKVIRKPNSIPSTAAGSKVYYYAWKSTDASDSVNGEMTKESSYTSGANTWADVWSVSLDAGYDRIVFASYSVTSTGDYQEGGTCTTELTIPSTLTNPCFYADNGDQCVYEWQWKNGSQIANPADKRRDGSWNEVHKITTDGNEITYTAAATGAEVRANDKLYVNTTFFDYFSDIELNGVDRGTIATGPSGTTPTLGYTNRTYVTHNLFNRALSDYYREKNVETPLYFGHFQWKQNSEGTYFKSIGNDLDLLGYDDRDMFYHNNNSEYRKDCPQCNEEGASTHSHATDVATQGLVDSSLSADDKLLMSDTHAPFFDTDFLTGANSYNTTLGKIYPSVYFPFTKINDYWTFDSKATNLRMTYDDANDRYFLKESTDPIKGYTNGYPTANSNFFPFDDADTSGNTNALNYGFGMKMEINFRLTPDGTIIKDTSGNSQDITFNFSGDDDIWIFIDGKLALDMGGGHGVVTGELNFRNKIATVSKIKTSNGEDTAVEKSFTLKGDNTDQHTLTMYYMERGLWESNMYVSFNFPDNNVFSVEKEVDTTGIDSLFTNNTNFKDNVKNLVFDMDIRNLATHYGPRTVDEMIQLASGVGFIMRQESISDYGSVTSGKAEPANGAKYNLFARGSNGSETLVEEDSRVANNVIGLKDKQLAKLTNKFRRGSYIVVTEKTSSMMKTLSGLSGDAAEQLLTDVFDTKYTIYSKDVEVSQADLQGDTYWVTGSSLSSLKDRPGVAANDGRKEKLVSGAKDMNGTPITHTTITEMPENAILFRNYIDTDSETIEMDLRLKYTNSFKTGAIAITKAQADGSAALNPNTSYSFTVTFDNVAGLKLEDTLDASYQVTDDNKIQQTFTLKSGETKTFTGIPAGTEYTISEAAPTDGSTLKSVTDSLASGTAPTGVGKDTATISAANVVSGTVTADESTSTVQTFTFYNHKEAPIGTGAIAVTKAQATGSANLNADTGYRFTVTFDNVTDSHWKDTLDSSYQVTGDKIQKTFTLKLGERQTFTGIPAGTEYTISEAAPTDGSTLKLVTDSLASGTAPTGVGKDTATISTANVVSGTVTADESTSTVQTFTFYNYKEATIETGAIAVTKAQAAGSANLNANTGYRFTVTFDNVTDSHWKDTLDSSYQVTGDKIQKTFTLKLGERQTFTGIPAGTEYTISEAAPTDGSTLKLVTDSLASGTAPTGVGKDTATISAANVVSGTVTADESTSTVQTFTFYNYKEATIETGAIAVTKAQAAGSADLNADTGYRFTVTFNNVTDSTWKDTLDSSYQVTGGNTVQKTFTLKLGERQTFTGIPAGTEYTISEATPTDGSTLKLVTDSLASATAPAGVGKDTATISAANVVSGTVTADQSTSTVQTFTFYNMKEKTPDPEPKTTSIKITKVDSGDSDKTLSGAVFRLVKLTSDGSVDNGFAAQELTTPKSGVITFSNLSDGTYRLTEAKAPSGYVQLKNPATIVIKDGKYTLENNGERTITNNTISFIIKNNKQTNPPKENPPKENPPKDTPKASTPPAKIFSLPKTGGIGTILYTLIGVACMGGVIVFFYMKKKKKA